MNRFVLVALVVLGMRAEASMIYAGPAVDSGGGIGAVLTILTVQDNDDDEEGCVGWGGTADVVGPAACPTGLTPPIVSKTGNGDEKTGNSQTQTVLISATGISSASSLIILLNVNEPAGNPFSPTASDPDAWADGAGELAAIRRVTATRSGCPGPVPSEQPATLEMTRPAMVAIFRFNIRHSLEWVRPPE